MLLVLAAFTSLQGRPFQTLATSRLLAPCPVARGATAKFANPQDFRSTGFALNDIPIGDPHQFSVAGTPPVPIIDHEMGKLQTALKRSRFELDALAPLCTWLNISLG